MSVIEVSKVYKKLRGHFTVYIVSATQQQFNRITTNYRLLANRKVLGRRSDVVKVGDHEIAVHVSGDCRLDARCSRINDKDQRRLFYLIHLLIGPFLKSDSTHWPTVTKN